MVSANAVIGLVLAGLGIAFFSGAFNRFTSTPMQSQTAQMESFILSDIATTTNQNLLQQEKRNFLDQIKNAQRTVNQQIKKLTNPPQKPMTRAERFAPRPKGSIFALSERGLIPIGITERGSRRTIEFFGGIDALRANRAEVERFRLEQATKLANLQRKSESLSDIRSQIESI